MPILKKLRAFIACLAVCAALLACKQPPQPRSEFVMGTVCTVNLFDEGTDALYTAVFDRLHAIEAEMSVNEGGTEVDKVNANAGIGPVAVTPDVFSVISTALRYAELSKGAFDPTIGPIVKLWNIMGEHPRVPAQAEIDAALKLVSYRDVVADSAAHSVFLTRKGMQLDLGGIAKGYAADEAVRIIKAAGLKRAIIDLGGNVYAYGDKKGGQPWRVGIQKPFTDRGEYVGIVTVKNKTLVTSGVYERYFVQNGVHYHHILSTKDGYPINNHLQSVSIVTDHSIDADALSTTVFALGWEVGSALVERLGNVEAIFIFDDNSIRIAGNRDFTLTDTSFHLAEEEKK
jgi:thiamine biosynthesis lipoprotein